MGIINIIGAGLGAYVGSKAVEIAYGNIVGENNKEYLRENGEVEVVEPSTVGTVILGVCGAALVLNGVKTIAKEIL